MTLAPRFSLLLVLTLGCANALAVSADYLDRSSAFDACAAEKSRQEAVGIPEVCGDDEECECIVRNETGPTCTVELGFYESGVFYGGGFGGNFTCVDPQIAASMTGLPETCPIPVKGGKDEYVCANPITIAIGNKFQAESDFDGPGLLDFVRYYNSHPSAGAGSLGPRWSHTYSTHVEVTAGGTIATVHLSHGRQIAFTLVSGAWQVAAGSAARLIELKNGSGVRTGWKYIEHDERQLDEFDAEGRLAFVRRLDGQVLTLVHNYGLNTTPAENQLVTSVTDQSGRSLQFDYDSNYRLVEMTDAGGTVHDYTYDSSYRLSSAGFMAGSVRTFREYKYNEGSLTAGANLPFALTGIVDENGDRYANYGYGANGMAVLSEHAGGAERFEVGHDLTDGSSTVLTPDQVTAARETVVINGQRRVTEVSESCGGCTTRTRSYTFDTNGQVDEYADERDVVTDYDYNGRGLVTQVVEAENDTNGDKRKIQTDWDATFNVPTERRVYDAANTLVAKWTWQYNARGQVTLARQHDPSSSAQRSTAFTYCESVGSGCPFVGLLKSVDGPKSGTTDSTTYSYRTADSLTGCGTFSGNCYRKGDLYTVTDGFGNSTQILRYDAAGRPTQIRDANQVETRLTYDAAGRVKTRTVLGSTSGGDALTAFDYDKVGQVEDVTAPDGSVMSFTYDAAHRLIAVTDGDLNTRTITIDDALRTQVEQFFDASTPPVSTFERTSARNEFGELASVTDAFGKETEFGYDPTGNLVSVVDAIGRVTEHSYDALGRLRQTIADAGTGNIAATSEFTYDALDQLTAVEDPNGLTTSYEYDGLGNLVELTSPDTGTATYSYNIAGERTGSVDARGKAGTYTYDRLGRLVGVDFTGTNSDSAYTYDSLPTACQTEETFSIGHLSSMTDPSGGSVFCYDRRGNTVRKVQTVTGASVTYTTRYGYDLADQLTSVTYPSGAVVTFGRDPQTGRITSVSGKASAGATPATLLSAVTYLPFGPAHVLTFGNGRTLTKDYDGNYGIDKVEDNATGGLSIDFGLDEVGNVT